MSPLRPFGHDANSSVEGPKYYIGIDFGQTEDATIILVLEKMDDNVLKCRAALRRVGVKYTEIVKEIKYIQNKLRPKQICIDATGLGKVILDMLTDEGVYTNPIVFTLKIKQELFQLTKTMFERNKIFLPASNYQMKRELLDWRCSKNTKGQNLLSHPSGGHDDYCIALILAVHAAVGEGTHVDPDAMYTAVGVNSKNWLNL